MAEALAAESRRALSIHVTENEASVENVTRWIAVHGERHGYRTPNTRERSKAIRMEAYLTELGLTERVLYAAQGNSFDAQAVSLIIQMGVHMWAAGELTRRHEIPRLHEVCQAYATVLDYVRSRRFVGCEFPFPHDLRTWAAEIDDDTPPPLTPPVQLADQRTGTAAEDGRLAG